MEEDDEAPSLAFDDVELIPRLIGLELPSVGVDQSSDDLLMSVW
jgi:hypothetical protein